MSNNILVDYSMEFSVFIVNICDGIKGKSALTNQLLRSGTSIGANINEANYGQSRADFIAKMHIALKETAETEYWIKLLYTSEYIDEKMGESLLTDCLAIK